MSWKVYVLHFDKPYKHAKHYTGIAKNIEKRIKLHRSGHGARLTQVLKENGISFTCRVIAEYPIFSMAHAEEKRLKKKVKNPNRYCPICKEIKEREMKCECGEEIPKEFLEGIFNKGYKDKMCLECMINYCNHAITGE